MPSIFSPVIAPINGYVTNGVANFAQSTNPTTRIDGSALVVGDKLYRTDLRIDAFWNGTYWLGLQLRSANYASPASPVAGSFALTELNRTPTGFSGVFVESFNIGGELFNAPQTGADFWDFTLVLYTAATIVINASQFTSKLIDTTTARWAFSAAINTAAIGTLNWTDLVIVRNASAGNARRFSCSVFYRFILS